MTSRDGGKRLLIGLAMVGLVSCSGGAGTPNARDAGRKAAGTEILAGLQVEPGSHLLGEAFPDTNGTSHPSQGHVNHGDQPWTALVAVDGDPVPVFDRYVTQFRRLGILLKPQDPGGPCSSAPAGRRRCASSDALDLSAARNSLVMRPAGREEFASDRFLITVTLTPQDSHRARTADRILPSQPREEGTIPPPDLPPPPPPAPRPPGEPIAPDISIATRSVVAPGSVLLAAATPTEFDGWKAVLRITGDPVRVGAALATSPYETIIGSKEVLGARTVLRWSWDEAGGDKLSVTALPDANGDWYALVDTYTDA